MRKVVYGNGLFCFNDIKDLPAPEVVYILGNVLKQFKKLLDNTFPV